MTMLANRTDGIVRHGKTIRPIPAVARLRTLGLLFWQAWGQYRAARAMRGLSPEMLKDIGVPFAEIDTVVRYGRPSRQHAAKRGSRS